MTKKTANTEGLSTEQAIAMALAAEHESLKSIVGCKAEAEHILEQARQAAHHISERTDTRITRVHQICKHIITEEINRLQHATASVTTGAGDKPRPEQAPVINAVTRLVESLTMAGKVTGNSDNSS